MEEVQVVNLPILEDHRGVFKKIFDQRIFDGFNIAQINQVTSCKEVLRGLHYQKDQYAESKVFTVSQGKLQLGYVDLRKGSTNYFESNSIIGCLNSTNDFTNFLK